MIDIERRRHDRRPLFRPLTIYRDGRRLSTGRTLNVSPIGACAVMPRRLHLHVGDAVRVDVDVPRRGSHGLQLEPVTTRAWVRRVEQLGEGEEAVALAFVQEVDVV